MGSMPQTFMTIGDVARYLKLGANTVRALIRRGELGFHKMGRSVRVSPENLQCYIDKTLHLPGPRKVLK